MSSRLRREEIVTLGVLAERGQNHCEIARLLGVTEGAVRYRLRRASRGEEDGRRNKRRRALEVEEAIRLWVAAKQEEARERPINVLELYEHLREEKGYDGSYKSVLRFVRERYPKPPVRTYRRVETPPGAQVQTDWAEYPRVDIGGGPQPLHAFVMTLSFSRRPAVVWRRGENQLHWLAAHNESFRRLGGIAATNRIDNVRTAIVRGAGAWGVINPVYRSYARAVRFHIDACAPRAANAKGKAESKVRLSRLLVDPGRRRFEGLEHLQRWTDLRIEQWCARAICPATGRTVQESWEEELRALQSLPDLPEPFDVVVSRPVHRDCMVLFEGRSYPVPFVHVGRRVEVRGCAETVQIVADGVVLREYPRGTAERVLVDPSCYEGESTAEVLAPPPLGKMGRRLQELSAMPVERRPIDLYAALAEVAR
ncbi:MAG: IS21 family transposase [Acidobacteria bacterium]|nr:IS21 family transposase [Acidobacteriota bacterium]